MANIIYINKTGTKSESQTKNKTTQHQNTRHKKNKTPNQSNTDKKPPKELETLQRKAATPPCNKERKVEPIGWARWTTAPHPPPNSNRTHTTTRL